MSSDLTKLTSEPRVTLQDLKGENQDKKLDSMDLNNDGQITTDEVAQFMALQMAQAAEETIEESISIKDEEKETSPSDDIESIVAEREDKSISTLLHSYKSGINSYKENVKLYQNYLNGSKSYLI